MKKKKLENPFRVTVYRKTTHWDCYSHKTKTAALKKFGDLLPDYFTKKSKEYPFKITLTQFVVDKQNKIAGKILLQAS